MERNKKGQLPDCHKKRTKKKTILLKIRQITDENLSTIIEITLQR